MNRFTTLLSKDYSSPEAPSFRNDSILSFGIQQGWPLTRPPQGGNAVQADQGMPIATGDEGVTQMKSA